MKQTFSGEYSSDWPAISLAAKEDAGWRCVRCSSPSVPGRILTVHHLDGDKSNNAWWNLLPLCQACHLSIQGRVIVSRDWMFEHSDWFKPYIAGFYAAQTGMEFNKEYVRSHIDECLALGQPWLYEGIFPINPPSGDED